MHTLTRVVLLWLGLILSVQAAPLPLDEVPSPLQAWTDWVLFPHTEQDCPVLVDGRAQVSRACRWPSYLTLTVQADHAEFTQQWQVYRTEWVPLPGTSVGSTPHWPQRVQINGEAAVVVDREGTPWVQLAAGQHTINGFFLWQTRPEAITVPPETGLVQLTIEARTIPTPRLDRRGQLWLQSTTSDHATTESNQLTLRVYRRIVDEIPLQVETQLMLEVAGRHREVRLGPVLLAGQLPMQLESALPTRLEPNGELRVQVRPGTWQIKLHSRHLGQATELTSPALSKAEIDTEQWVTEELWAFEARPQLRVVELQGLTAIDPQQTNLPEAWRQFPTYQVTAGQQLQLLEKRRGNPQTLPDQLTLERHFWLDFDGQGYSLKDNIRGSMNNGWRLEMTHSSPTALQQAEGLRLGRVSVNGQDQLITRLTPESNMGVEVRHGNLEVQADSRLEQGLSQLPAVAWLHGDAEQSQFQQVQATLHLPPGWLLFNVAGVDGVSATWLQQWTLLELFIVLILSLAVGKLWGYHWGALTLLTLVISYHQNPLLPWIWLQIIAALALLRALPSMGRFQWWVKGYRNLSLIVLLIAVIPFLIQEVRVSFFPHLARPSQHLSESNYYYPSSNLATPSPMAEPRTEMAKRMLDESGFYEQESASAVADSLLQPGLKRQNLVQIDPNAQVQTGPGLPHWQWQTIDLYWSGPVQHDQHIEVWLVSPQWTQVIGLFRALLVTLLTAFFLWLAWAKSARQFFYNAHSGGQTAAVLAISALLVPFIWPTDSHAQASNPTPDLLNALEQRLLAPPDCLPHCISSPHAFLTLTETGLTVRQQVHAQIAAAIPLPGQDRHWLPQQVWLNGEAASALQRDTAGHLWLQVPPGIHDVQLSGTVPARSSWQLPFLLKPKQMRVTTEAWQVEGLRENDYIADTLQFTRQQLAADNAALEMGSLPPLVQVERTLALGLDWQVHTRLTRLTPLGSAVVLEIPLLAGESVTSEHIRVVQGQAQLSLSPQQKTAEWVSVLQPNNTLRLTASEQLSIIEVWRLDASAIWHVELSGIPVVHHQRDGRWLPEWRPLPGESVELQLTRPLGVTGQILTLDSSVLTVHPGQRSTDYELTLNLRSSRGLRHPITLPAEFDLQSMRVGGEAQPIQQQGQQVILPIRPGHQTIVLELRQAQGLTAWFTTPRIDLGLASVNSRIEVYPPGERWILYTGGQAIGPAVLIWGVLLVMTALAFGLGRTGLTPLRTHHWLLLTLVLTPLSVELALIVVGWLLMLGWRQRLNKPASPITFDFLQVVIVCWTGVALLVLLLGIEQGLLGRPDMHIGGNGSYTDQLRWYQDRIGAELPQVWFFSLSMWVYRILMLLWALWLAFALLRWLRWGWTVFTAQGLWETLWQRNKRPSGQTV